MGRSAPGFRKGELKPPRKMDLRTPLYKGYLAVAALTGGNLQFCAHTPRIKPPGKARPMITSGLPTIRECTPVCGHLGVYRY